MYNCCFDIYALMDQWILKYADLSRERVTHNRKVQIYYPSAAFIGLPS